MNPIQPTSGQDTNNSPFSNKKGTTFAVPSFNNIKIENPYFTSNPPEPIAKPSEYNSMVYLPGL